MMRGVITLCGWIGVAVFVADGFRSRDRLLALVRLALVMATVLAALGLVQFATGFDIVNNLRIPGLGPEQ